MLCILAAMLGIGNYNIEYEHPCLQLLHPRQDRTEMHNTAATVDSGRKLKAWG